MRKYIEQATKQFFHETLAVRCEKYDKFPLLGIYSALITISEIDKKHHFSLCMSEETLLLVSEILLCEENPDEETKVDLISECANLIVGAAKVAIEEDRDGI